MARRAASDWGWAIEPVGTVRPAGRGYLWVIGETQAYLYDPIIGACSCADFLFRKRPGDRCKHRVFVEGYLWRRASQGGLALELSEEELLDLFS